MDFEDTFFDASHIVEEIDGSLNYDQRPPTTMPQGQLTSTRDTQTSLHSEKSDSAPSSAAASQQNFYPTPISTNMQADGHERLYMSPFPSEYQKFSTMNADGSFVDLDDLLFTPMMSPAMTPMQQYRGHQNHAEVDWEHFDQNLFALTAPAIDGGRTSQNFRPDLLAQAGGIGMEPLAKKQKVVPTNKKGSRHSSPGTPYMGAIARGNVDYTHKKDRSMAAPSAVPQHIEQSPDSNDAVSPLDFGQFTSGITTNAPGGLRRDQIHPITPSMLMSLQSKGSESGDSVSDVSLNLPLDTSNMTRSAPDYNKTAMPSPSRRASSSSQRHILPGPAVPVQRDVRPRPLMPAHGKSKSVSSSPALGPQKSKASPDLRAILPGGMSPQVGAILASKSNYQHIVDGTYDQLNISYPEGMTQGLEIRRTSHKAAEQKRRDHLKECFESLRTILPDSPEPGASKVAILRKGYEHILQIHELIKQKDAEIERLRLNSGGTQDTPESDVSEKATIEPPSVS